MRCTISDSLLFILRTNSCLLTIVTWHSWIFKMTDHQSVLSSPTVEEKVVPTLLNTAAFGSDTCLADVHFTDSALKVAPTPFFWHQTSLTCKRTQTIDEKTIDYGQTNVHLSVVSVRGVHPMRAECDSSVHTNLRGITIRDQPINTRNFSCL